MVRPILYKSVTRCSIALAVILLWDRFIDSSLHAFRDAGAVAAIFLFMMSWFSYLKLDGMKVHFMMEDKLKKKPKKHWKTSMIDFVDEHIVTFDELNEEEQTACLMASNLISGLVFLIVSMVAGI